MIYHLTLPPLKLVEQGLGLGPDVEFGVVVDEQDEVGVVDEPLAGVVEGILPVHLPRASLQHAGNLGESRLQNWSQMTKVPSALFSFRFGISQELLIRKIYSIPSKMSVSCGKATPNRLLERPTLRLTHAAPNSLPSTANPRLMSSFSSSSSSSSRCALVSLCSTSKTDSPVPGVCWAFSWHAAF